MKLVCSVFDKKAQLWSTPFFSHSDVVAIRDFAAAVKGSGGIAQFPDDYELWSIGQWDDVSGDFVPYVNRNYLVSGADFKKES